MATGKRYYWMKLKESFMTSDTIDYFMSQPSGANYVVLYQMLCLKTINTGGRLSRQIGEIIIPYDVEKIQRDCKWFSVDTIRIALKLYQAAGLIYEDRDGVLVLADHANLVGSETNWAQQKRKQKISAREKFDLVSGNLVESKVENFHPDNRDKILDNRDKDLEIEVKNSEVYTSTPHEEDALVNCPYSKIKELYHKICVSYPKIKAIDGNRKTAVGARWRTYKSIKTFQELFTIAEASNFLKGVNERNWSADFDWMMKPTNFSKILEHKYDDRTPAETSLSGAIGTLAKMYEEASKNE